MAVVGGHIGGEDNPGYGQSGVQVETAAHAHYERIELWMFIPIKIQLSATRSIEKDYLCIPQQLLAQMITPEEYNRKKDDDEEMGQLPIAAVVVIIVLASLVGVFIVSQAIFGL